jgi:hypothetical protein
MKDECLSAVGKKEILISLSYDGVQPQSAWRIAAESWLRMKGLIKVIINGKVSPNSF